jgi:hypothetical protein
VWDPRHNMPRSLVPPTPWGLDDLLPHLRRFPQSSPPGQIPLEVHEPPLDALTGAPVDWMVRRHGGYLGEHWIREQIPTSRDTARTEDTSRPSTVRRPRTVLPLSAPRTPLTGLSVESIQLSRTPLPPVSDSSRPMTAPGPLSWSQGGTGRSITRRRR